MSYVAGEDCVCSFKVRETQTGGGTLWSGGTELIHNLKELATSPAATQRHTDLSRQREQFQRDQLLTSRLEMFSQSTLQVGRAQQS